MAVLSDAQIAAFARGAGFTGNDVAIAVAVALAESGGNPRAHNGNTATGDNSYGLWQINMLGAMGPARRKQFGISNNDALFDPATNARAARAIYKGSNSWRPWSTYNSGSYLRFMSRGKAAANSSGGFGSDTDFGGGDFGSNNRPDTPLPDSIENTIYDMRDAISGISDFVGWITNKDNWIRVGMFIGGVILVVVGVLTFVGQSKAARTAVQVAKAVK